MAALLSFLNPWADAEHSPTGVPSEPPTGDDDGDSRMAPESPLQSHTHDRQPQQQLPAAGSVPPRAWTYNDFALKMNRREALSLLRRIREYVEQSSGREHFKADHLAELHRFVEEMNQDIARHSLWAECCEGELENAFDGLEKFIACKLYPKLFAVDRRRLRSQGDFDRKLTALSWVQPGHLDIFVPAASSSSSGTPSPAAVASTPTAEPSATEPPSPEPGPQSLDANASPPAATGVDPQPDAPRNQLDLELMVRRAGQELDRMNTVKSPRDKLDCLLRACLTLMNWLKLVNQLPQTSKAPPTDAGLAPAEGSDDVEAAAGETESDEDGEEEQDEETEEAEQQDGAESQQSEGDDDADASSDGEPEDTCQAAASRRPPDSDSCGADQDDGDTTTASPRRPSADDFLPLLIWMVIRSRPRQLVSNLDYIASVRVPGRLTGESQYFFTHLQSAVSFVLSCDFHCFSGVPDQTDFNGLCVRALREAGLEVPDSLLEEPSEFYSGGGGGGPAGMSASDSSQSLAHTSSSDSEDFRLLHRRSLSGGSSRSRGSSSSSSQSLPATPSQQHQQQQGLELAATENLVLGSPKPSTPQPPQQRERRASKQQPDPARGRQDAAAFRQMVWAVDPQELSFTQTEFEELRAADVPDLLRQYQRMAGVLLGMQARLRQAGFAPERLS